VLAVCILATDDRGVLRAGAQEDAGDSDDGSTFWASWTASQMEETPT
jgi:hypothetical protein